MSMWKQCGALVLVAALTGCANDGTTAPDVAPAFAASGSAATTPSLVDVAIATNSAGAFEGQFDTLIAAILAADPAVLETLGAPGQRTVFAPTDDAFAALGLDASNVGTLPQEFLTQVLLTHVIKGRRDAAEVTSSTQLRTLQGSFLDVSGATLSDPLGRQANIIVTDIGARNGIIHAIDAVVLPFAP